MAEICREPLVFSLNGTDYAAFDENHSLRDIARWVMASGKSDAEELVCVLTEMLKSAEG